MSHKTSQRNISRLMALLLCALLLVPCIPVVRADGESGSCGDNLSWSLSAGTLTISGSGAMTDFPESTMAPWHPYREEILNLQLPDGLTTIGDLAFYGCRHLTSAAIPNSVTAIGHYAFAGCENMQMLSLGSGVRTIGEAAFSDCYSLKSLDLPGSLISIGKKGFYRCESITSVTVPSSVTSMGVSVFAYCENLVSANIQATVKVLPEYLFYGCERLTSVVLPDVTEDIGDFSFRGCDGLSTVYYNGTSQSPEQIQSSIGNAAPNFTNNGSVNSGTSTGTPVTSTTIQQNANGSTTQNNVSVTPGSNSSVSSNVEHTYQPDGTHEETKVEITVNVNGSQGWEEAKDNLEQELEKELENNSDKTDKVIVNVFVKDTDEIDSDFVESLVGKPVDVIITTQNGSSWKMDAAKLDSEAASHKYNLNYTLAAGTEELTAELGGNASFVLKFAESAKVNAEVLIRLGNTWANQGATLFQREKDGVSRIQAALVDYDGFAHFYLASVDKDTEYYIGMNVPLDTPEEAPIVPEEMLTNYGNAENIQPIQYEITGRKSSWNMGLGKVMAILAAVMVSAIVVVGAVMFFWNKQRLKNGYVPKWEDDEE